LWIPFTLAWGLFPDAPFNLSRPFALPLTWFLVFMIWWLTGLLAQVGRYRRASGPVQRQQTRWIIFCCAAGILVYGVVYALGVVLPAFSELRAINVLFALFGAPLFPLFVVPIPLSIAFAALRYRLFDIDFFLNRALVYGLLTAALASIYFGSVVVLQILFRAFVPFFHSQAAGPISPVIIAISTLAVAALFSLARRRAQDFIDRRFFRRRYDAAQTLAAFGAAARDEVNLAQLIERLEAVVREVFQPAHISAWLSVPGGFSVRLSEIGAEQELTVANDDSLMSCLRSAAGAVELDSLAFESAADR
jgi:hypothetical protein